MSELPAPRDVVTFSPPGGTFRKGDYPWLVAVRVTARGGDGGPAADGTPGSSGETTVKLIPVSDLKDEEEVKVGRGGSSGGPYGKSGEDGFLIVELYDTMPES